MHATWFNTCQNLRNRGQFETGKPIPFNRIKFKPEEMKKIFLLLVLAATFSSCKKTYTCDCTTTFNYLSSGSYPSTTYESNSVAYTNQMTKRKATAACEHEGKNINSTYVNIKTNNSPGSLSGVSIATECKLH